MIGEEADRSAVEEPLAGPATEISPEAREALLAAARRIAAQPKKDKAGRARTGRRRGRPPGMSWRLYDRPDPNVPGDDGYVPTIPVPVGEYRTWEQIMDLPRDLQIAIGWSLATERGLRGTKRDDFIIGLTGVSHARLHKHRDRDAWRAEAALFLRLSRPIAPIDP